MDKLIHHKFTENEEVNTQGRGLCRVVAILKNEHENGGYVKADDGENYDNKGYDFQDLLLQSVSTGELLVGSQCRTFENENGKQSICWGQGHYNLDMKEVGIWLATTYSTRNNLTNASLEFNASWDFDEIATNRHPEAYDYNPFIFEVKISGVSINNRLYLPSKNYKDDIHIGLIVTGVESPTNASTELVAFYDVGDKKVDITDIVEERLSYKEIDFIKDSFTRTLEKENTHPELSYSLLNSSIRKVDGVEKGDAIVIKWGEHGFYPYSKGNLFSQDEINDLNEKLGVSKAEAKAMEICSMQDCDWNSHFPKVRDSFQKKMQEAER